MNLSLYQILIAALTVIVVMAMIWWLLARRKPDEIAPSAEPAKPAKPLEPVKPDIVVAEPARFKPVEPVPAPRPIPAAPPVAVPTPAPEPEPATAPEAPPPEPAPDPVAPKAPAPEEPITPPPAPGPVAAPEPAAAPSDNLQLIKGLGPKLAALLNGLGVTGFQQIADWTDADIAAIDPQLGAFQGRITRDNFVDQATYLARGDTAGFAAKYGALGGEL